MLRRCVALLPGMQKQRLLRKLNAPSDLQVGFVKTQEVEVFSLLVQASPVSRSLMDIVSAENVDRRRSIQPLYQLFLKEFALDSEASMVLPSA